MNVRGWNILLLTALGRDSSRCASLLLQNFYVFTLAYYTSLTPGSPAAPDYVALDDIDISRAYITIKLWLILARKVAQGGEVNEFDTEGTTETEEGEAASITMIWNQLWPLFEIVLLALEHEGRAGSALVSLQNLSCC